MGRAPRFAVVATVAWLGCAPSVAKAPLPSPTAVASGAKTTQADPNRPEYWVEKLDTASERAAAVRRLEEMFGDLVTRANHDRTAPEVRDFVGRTVAPLSELYVRHYERLDVKTRVVVIRLLADYRDARTAPALKKAFEEFAQAPPTSRDETDVKWAARAQEELRIESVSMALFEAFLTLRVSTLLGGVVYRDVYQAVVAQAPNSAWVEPLIAKLEVTMKPLAPKDPKSFDDYRDELFWQTAAAEVLGQIGDVRAVEPLFEVVLDPAKVDIAYTAGLALVQLGRPAVDVGIKLLRSERAELQAFHVRRIEEVTGKKPTGKPWVPLAAKVLGAAGRPEAVAPLIAAVETERDPEVKVVLADALTRIRGTPESKAAFKKAFRRASPKALPDLAEAMGHFMDPELVPFMLETAEKLGGPKSDREAAQSRLLGAALRLARPSQMDRVKAAAGKLGVHDVQRDITRVEPLVARCREDGACYLEALRNPENQNESKQIVGIKAGYMVGILGNDALRDELVGSLSPVTNPVVRFVAALAIDQLTPSGSRDVARRLREIVERNAKSPDRDKAAGDHSLKQVMIRLEARAS